MFRMKEPAGADSRTHPMFSRLSTCPAAAAAESVIGAA